MANDKDTIFEVNAGLILAKLHLASKNMFKNIDFYNSGIIGDDKGTPEKPNDCMFDLKNKTGLYEIACTLLKFYYIRKFTSDETNKLKSKMIQPEGKELAEDKFNKLKEDLTKKLDSFNNDKNDKPKIILQLEKFLNDMLKLGHKYLKTYLENFCGKENASKLKETDLVNTYIDDNFDKKYDNYTIPKAKNLKLLKKLEETSIKNTEKELDKLTNIEDIKQFLEDDKNLEKNLRIDVDNAKVHLAFKTSYTVELETM